MYELPFGAGEPGCKHSVSVLLCSHNTLTVIQDSAVFVACQ